MSIEKLKAKLSRKSSRVNLRYKYYEMKNVVKDFSSIIPANFRYLSNSLGWCAKAVDSMADRISFDEFENDDFLINQIFRLNNSDILIDDLVKSALISSCSFVYICLGDDGYPRLQAIDGGNATGVIDPVTQMLREGYAVLERDEHFKPTLEAYFEAGATHYFQNGQLVDTQENSAPYALLVPIINRPDAVRPFGHSRISRTGMDLTQSALRTLKRSEVCAEFYSFPQKYALGLSDDAEFDNRMATISSFLSFGKDEDGDKPSLGQFQQQSMTPYIEQMKMFASLFAADAGLTPDDLGFVSDNPSSVEAIKASHENLRVMARKAQRDFGVGLLNAGFLACCVRDDKAYERKAFCDTKAMWLPIFEPDASTLSGVGDAILKINQAVPGYLGAKNIKKLTGMGEDNE